MYVLLGEPSVTDVWREPGEMDYAYLVPRDEPE